MNEDPNSGWCVYLLEVVRADGRRMLYTGITRNIARRVEQHAAGKGAKCLRGVTVLGVAWHSPRMTKSQALKAEAAVKRLAPAEKHDFKLVSDLVRRYAR
jgi:putative endonuclease